MTLGEYVKLRNGVPMSAPYSLRNMLYRSFGAGNPATFWKHWNPIWGYYLRKFSYNPLSSMLPRFVAVIVTFLLSGFIHDLVIMVLRGKAAFLFIPWFFFISLTVIGGNLLKTDYSKYPFAVRALINFLIIGVCFAAAYQIQI